MTADELTATHYRDAFIERTAKARDHAGYTQKQLASLLGLEQDTYKQYETRSLLPHRYIPHFCLICRCNETWLLSGEGPMERNSRSAA